MSEYSVWRTWKPYAAIAVVAIGAFWWFNNQSSLASLKDGQYDCTAVFVNSSGKYEILVDEAGTPYPPATAMVQGGDLVSLSSASALTSDQLDALTVKTRGNSHFEATDDPAAHSYNAIACDYAGG